MQKDKAGPNAAAGSIFAKNGMDLCLLRGAEYRTRRYRANIATVRYIHNAQQCRMKFYFSRGGYKCFLEKIFLRLPLARPFFFLGLLYLFHEIAFAVAVHPGFVPVLAKLTCDIIAIQLKACVNE